VRDHELTASDVASIYIGTQANVGLSGPPQLIAPQGETAPQGGAAPAPATGIPQPPNFPPGGVAGPPTGSPGGVQPTQPPNTIPGTSPVPGSPAGACARDGSRAGSWCARDADARESHTRAAGDDAARGGESTAGPAAGTDADAAVESGADDTRADHRDAAGDDVPGGGRTLHRTDNDQ
jgi:hypothetical protein